MPYSPWWVVNVHWATRLQFYPRSDLLVEILLLSSLRRGLLLPGLFLDIADLLDSGALVL